MTGFVQFRRSALSFTWSLMLAAGVCGCGSRTGTVKGKAAIDGKPAVGATVMLSAGENRVTEAPVHDDGTYEASGVPVGPVKLFIQPGPARTGMANMAQSSGPSARIPLRYTRLDTSGLSLDVKGGSNDFNIEMISK